MPIGPNDPILGEWYCSAGFTLIFKPDGTFEQILISTMGGGWNTHTWGTFEKSYTYYILHCKTEGYSKEKARPKPGEIRLIMEDENHLRDSRSGFRFFRAIK